MSEITKTHAAMPIVITLIERDIMPLIRKVLIKRAQLYLQEIEQQLDETSAAPSAPQESQSNG